MPMARKINDCTHLVFSFKLTAVLNTGDDYTIAEPQ